jgi:hypothetical protein
MHRNSDRGAQAHRSEKIRQQRMKKGKRIVSGKIYLAPKMTMSKKKKMTKTDPLSIKKKETVEK